MKERIRNRRHLPLMAAVLVFTSLAATEAGVFPVADAVLIEKSKRKLHLISDGEPFRSFDIALGIQPIGDKTKEGDFRTPEGRYTLDARNPNSEFFLSIHVSYPDRADRSEAAALGVDPGGSIMIHGQPNVPTKSEVYYRTQDWTNGCIAVSNSDMIDIWLMTGEYTPIEIRP
jgi:murein L,D-transpeptidase YafK